MEGVARDLRADHGILAKHPPLLDVGFLLCDELHGFDELVSRDSNEDVGTVHNRWDDHTVDSQRVSAIHHRLVGLKGPAVRAHVLVPIETLVSSFDQVGFVLTETYGALEIAPYSLIVDPDKGFLNLILVLESLNQ